MNKVFLKASFLSVFLAPVLLLAGAPLAQAQVYSTYGTTVYPTTSTYSVPAYTAPVYTTSVVPVASSACIDLTAPLTIGVSDYLVGGQVSELQTFLVRDGLLSSAYITGYYGSLTASAVSQFQASRGISPVGVVGPATRAAIEQVSCGNIGIVSPAQPITPIYPTNPTYPISPVNPGGPIIFNYGRPDLNSLSVNYNGPTAVITIQGSGFAPTNNIVYFGNEAISGVSSNGTQISFNVPSVAPGNYQIYVTNSYGSSNSLSYTVGNNNNNGGNCYTVNGSYECNCVIPPSYSTTNFSYSNPTCGQYDGQQVVLTSISGSGTTGATATIYGSGFTTNGNTVYFGSQVISNVYSSNGTTLTFNVPYVSYTNGNSYSVYVINGNDVTSNTIQFNVNGGSYNNSQISISYLSPAQGSIGTQVAIEGNGFTQYNTVHFGSGSSVNLPDYNNGDTLYFTIPSVTSGTYPIYVTNQNGNNSNSVNFQVY